MEDTDTYEFVNEPEDRYPAALEDTKARKPVKDYGSDNGPWNNRSRVVVRKNGRLPKRCIRCNKSVNTCCTEILRWQPRGRSHGVIGAIDMIARSESYNVTYSRCDACEPSINPKLLSTILGTVGAVLGLGGLVMMIVVSPRAMFIGFALAAILWIAAIVAAVWPHELRIALRSDRYLWLTGASAEFLRSLPTYVPGGDRPYMPTPSEALHKTIRPLRFVSAFVAALSLFMGINFFRLWLPRFEVRNAPLVKARVVERREAKKELNIPGAEFTLRLKDRTVLHAIEDRHSLKVVPETVMIHYTGDPSRPVFLPAYEQNDPFWIMVLFLSIFVFLSFISVLAWRGPRPELG